MAGEGPGGQAALLLMQAPDAHPGPGLMRGEEAANDEDHCDATPCIFF